MATTLDRIELIRALREESHRWHQEYGHSQYIVLRQDLQRMQSLMASAARALAEEKS